MEIKSAQLVVRVHANYIQTSVRFNYTPLSYVEYTIGGAGRLGTLLHVQTVDYLEKTAQALFRSSAEATTQEGMIGFDGYMFMDLRFEDVNNLTHFTVMELRYVDPSFGGVDLASALQNTFVNATLRHKLVQTLLDMIEVRNVEAFKNALRGMNRAR